MAQQDVPEITVELTDRRSVLPEATLAGALAGVSFLVLVESGLGTVSTVGYPQVFDGSIVTLQWGFHLLFATMFGSVFGLLVNSRPFWRYGRGFLGPLVGGAYGLVLGVVAAALFGALGLAAGSLLLEPAPVPVSLGSHFTYGVLVGSILNGIGLLRA
jgi:hypothetical protein